MPTDLIECREYVLTPLGGDQAVYTLFDCTLHPDEEGAHRWVAHQIRESGSGVGISTEAGTLPGKAWTTAPVQAVEFEVTVGADLENVPFFLPGENDVDLLPEDEFPDDAPLPPDDHEGG